MKSGCIYLHFIPLHHRDNSPRTRDRGYDDSLIQSHFQIKQITHVSFPRFPGNIPRAA
jgi:hypothetical protein